MIREMARRTFLKTSVAATASAVLPQTATSAEMSKPIRVGVIGYGGRGQHLAKVLMTFEDVEVPAVCDLDPARAASSREHAAGRQRPEPETYAGKPDAYKELLTRNDLDAVVIATPWDLHTPMSVDAMKAGKYVASEVPIAINMEQCWDLVRTYEETGVPCMMLENWSFRRDNLAVLNMIRKGMFGEMVHAHCSYSHDCTSICFLDRHGNDNWRAKFFIERNCNQYPTHALGPVLSWFDINCGDTYDYLTATATDSRGINAFFARRFGADHPGAKRRYAQSDIVTSTIRTKKGRSIVINSDMQLPRPYDNRWLAQGTLGVYNEQRDALYLVDHSPKGHQWEPFGPYQEKYDHPWWRTMAKKSLSRFGHGGTDYLELQQFLKAVRNKTEVPIDIYDSVMMSVVTPLSEMSLAQGGKPIPCPDFTKGQWRTRQPTFAVEGV